MKRYFLLCYCLLTFFSSYAQQDFTLKVKLSNMKGYTPLLLYQFNGKQVIDSVYKTEQGWMVFRGKVNSPVVAAFAIPNNPALRFKVGERYSARGPSLELFLSNDEITVVGDADSVYMAKVNGGTANKEWSVIKSKQDELSHQTFKLTKKTYDNFKPEGDTVEVGKLRKLSLKNEEEDSKLRSDFMKQYPNSLVSMYFLSLMKTSLSIEELKAAYIKLGSKNSFYGKEIAAKIESMEATAIGKSAINIRKKDINGREISLETFKGKYVLLDFWGSWCGPCRASHPHLKELYAKYKANGFEILGIAFERASTLEENQKKWRDAVKEDGIDWLQVLNNDGVDHFDAVKAYGISVFPTKILIDKEGKIIRTYVGNSKEVDVKLKEIFGK